MQAASGTTTTPALSRHHKPSLVSYDSGAEFSFYHWIEVRRIVDECEIVIEEEGLLSSGNREEALEESYQK